MRRTVTIILFAWVLLGAPALSQTEFSGSIGGGDIPRASTPICFAYPYGSDSSPGRTLASAKQHANACVDELISQGARGTIYLQDGGSGHSVTAATVTDPPGTGIWWMMSRDPNYAALSPGLTLTASSGSVRGVTTYTGIIAPHATLTGNTATQYFHFSGFSNAGNNGLIRCSRATATALVCNNPAGVAETHAGLAVLAGWRNVPSNNSINIIGIGGSCPTIAGTGAKTCFSAGSSRDPNLPVIWFSGQSGKRIHGLTLDGCSPMKLGLDSAGNRAQNETSAWNNWFDFDWFATSAAAGCGPAVDIGSSDNENLFNNVGFQGNPREAAAISTLSRTSNVTTVTTRESLPSSWVTGTVLGILGVADSSYNGAKLPIKITGPHTFTYVNDGANGSSTGGYVSSDQAQAVIINPGSASFQTPGLNFFTDIFSSSGGMKLYGGAGGASAFVDYWIQEGSPSPIVWFASGPCPSGTLKNLVPSDNYANFASVRNDTGCSSPQLIVERSSADGPALLVGGSGSSTSGQSPILNGQSGTYNGWSFSQTNHARRGFGPVAAPYPNIVRPKRDWGGGGVTVTCGQPAPDGTFNACNFSSASNLYGYLYSQPHAAAAGDVVIAGTWVRAVTGGYYGRPDPLELFWNGGISVTDTWKISGGSPNANGEWDWDWAAFKVASVSRSPGNLVMGVTVCGANNVAVYAPVLIYLPAGTVTDNEAAEIAFTLQSYRNDAAAGQVSLLPGEQFKADSIQVGDGPTITSGLGPPKGHASPGSIYLRRDGTPGLTFFVYEGDGWKSHF